MLIKAELDYLHAQRLTQLQQRLQKPLPEVLAMIIDWATSYSGNNLTILPDVFQDGNLTFV